MFNNNSIKIVLSLLILLIPFQIVHAAYSPYSVYVSSCHPKPKKKYFGLCGTTGPVFFGAAANQGIQANTVGYSMGLGGAAFFLEADLYDIFKVGAALSGYIMQFKPGNDVANVTPKVKVTAGTPALYGGFNYKGAFFYMTVATGILKYNTSRTISIANQIATARFEARQNSVRGRIGYAIPLGSLEITPMAVIDNVNFRKGAYIETGAGAFNVAVKNGEVSASQTSFGVRFAEVSEPEIFYPEFHFFSFSDGKSTRLKLISRFLDGVPPIVLEGITPGANGYNVGGSISTNIFGRNVFVIASYDYETRQKGFTSHSLFLRMKAVF